MLIMAEISLSIFERILKKAGAARVSKSALEEFAKIMEERLVLVAEEAAALAKHASRKTITDSDIRVARKKFE